MKFKLLTLLFITSIFGTKAQTGQLTCHFGITFEVSDNPTWGYGEPVVLGVQPHSPADLAGIKVGDIIMEINDKATYLRNSETISSWLFNESQEPVTFTIRNLNTYFKEYRLARICTDVNSISESDLATAFSFYSLEDTNERSFVLPIKTEVNDNVDYSDYHTYDFLIDPEAPEIDGIIMKYLEDALTQKGLTRNTKDPDFIVQTYYSFLPNAKYTGVGRAEKGNKTWRYDMDKEELALLPILDGAEYLPETKGQYVLELGVRFLDKKYIESKELIQIWDCNAKEYLTEQYDLGEYARIHIPLLMMQFPYSTNRTSPTYTVSSKRYNYTGMYFDTNDMKTVLDVDVDSPAHKAGMRAGTEIKKINDFKFNETRDGLMNGYKRFLNETMVYRDPMTKFTNAKGYPDCMFWAKNRYNDVEKALKKSLYVANFSYLYNFERYIPKKSGTTLDIDASVRGGSRHYTITPEIRSSVVVTCK